MSLHSTGTECAGGAGFDDCRSRVPSVVSYEHTSEQPESATNARGIFRFSESTDRRGGLGIGASCVAFAAVSDTIAEAVCDVRTGGFGRFDSDRSVDRSSGTEGLPRNSDRAHRRRTNCGEDRSVTRSAEIRYDGIRDGFGHRPFDDRNRCRYARTPAANCVSRGATTASGAAIRYLDRSSCHGTVKRRC